jgi:hypothetical protein
MMKVKAIWEGRWGTTWWIRTNMVLNTEGRMGRGKSGASITGQS